MDMRKTIEQSAFEQTVERIDSKIRRLNEQGRVVTGITIDSIDTFSLTYHTIESE